MKKHFQSILWKGTNYRSNEETFRSSKPEWLPIFLNRLNHGKKWLNAIFNISENRFVSLLLPSVDLKIFLEVSKTFLSIFPIRPILIFFFYCSAITSSAKLKRRKKCDFQTYFHPEFVTKQKFPAILWYKSTLLPSILHRMQYILLAEEVRQTIVRKAKVGNLHIPMGKL